MTTRELITEQQIKKAQKRLEQFNDIVDMYDSEINSSNIELVRSGIIAGNLKASNLSLEEYHKHFKEYAHSSVKSLKIETLEKILDYFSKYKQENILKNNNQFSCKMNNQFDLEDEKGMLNLLYI